ncbi:MAG: aspartate aminotransferase family protein [Candidatus Thermoplasmatota archaeon]|nr:aspartate aminotransferase family protein [Candidatus Thermoplasmatota archaeon]
MYTREIKNAINYDRTKHPERTNATFGRVAEVLENVLESKSDELIISLQKKLGSVEMDAELSEEHAEKIVSTLNAHALTPDQLHAIALQLQSSEISTEEALALHKKYKVPVSHLEKDIIPVAGNGCWIQDTKGNWYIDMDSNYSATNLGMSNPEIGQGLYNQANLLISMKEDRVQIARTRFLKEMSDMMPKDLNYFYWQNSGGEAVDKALKIAKAYTDSKQVIAFKNGFHGRTHGAVSVTWNEAYRKPFHLNNEDWVHFATFNDIESVKKLVEKTGTKIIIMEMIQGEEAGNLPADPDFIKQLWNLKKEKDLIIIDDEVQAGFGRTAVKKGDWFACQSYQVVPDIMTIGKSFGGSYPVTAVVTNEKISQSMKPGYDGSTFGGNPMAMTSALIATRQMKEQEITKNVIARSKQFFDGLEQLQQKNDMIEDIQGRGLMISLLLGSEENVSKVQDNLKEHGVKTSLSTGKYLRFLPPTIISESEVNLVLDRLDTSIQQC